MAESYLMKTGLFVGRFQPFHNGHLAAVKFALERVELLYVAVGSAQKSHELSNPFTAAERIMMIRSTLIEGGIDCKRWLLIPVPDATAHSAWVTLVHAFVPPFEVVFSNDPLTERLFKKRRMQVVEVPLLKRNAYSATQIRGEMIEGDGWESKVPHAVSRILKEINAVERLRMLSAKG